MFDNLLQYLCVSRGKQQKDDKDELLTAVASQYTCSYCGQNFGFGVLYSLHVSSCAKSQSTLPDPNQSEDSKTSKMPPAAVPKKHHRPLKHSSSLPAKQFEQLIEITENLKKQTGEKRCREEHHFLTKYAQKHCDKTFYISNIWLKAYLNYLKDDQNKRPGQIDNSEIAYKMKQTHYKSSLDHQALGTNEIIWQFLVMMYGGGPEVAVEGEPSSVFKRAIDNLRIHSHNSIPEDEKDTDHHVLKEPDFRKTATSAFNKSSSNITTINILKGLQNEGFYCYLNSCLQVLLGIMELVDFLKYERFKPDIRVSSSKFWKAMAEAVALMESSKSSSIVPQSLRKLAVTRFRPNEQHDVHEFMYFILCGMQDEINIPRPKGTVNLNDPEAAWAYYNKYNISLVDQLFAGQLLSILTCGKCGHISKTYEVFLELTLPMVPQKCGSVEECLQVFTVREELNSGYQCEKCKVKGKVYKEIILSKLPKILVVHLNRIQMRPRKTKIRGHVEFPVDIWRIKIDQKREEKIYGLIGLVCHLGAADSGHYIAYTKRNHSWYLCDDNKIKQVSEKQVAENEAYILLYQQLN